MNVERTLARGEPGAHVGRHIGEGPDVALLQPGERSDQVARTESAAERVLPRQVGLIARGRGEPHERAECVRGVRIGMCAGQGMGARVRRRRKACRGDDSRTPRDARHALGTRVEPASPRRVPVAWGASTRAPGEIARRAPAAWTARAGMSPTAAGRTASAGVPATTTARTGRPGERPTGTTRIGAARTPGTGAARTAGIGTAGTASARATTGISPPRAAGTGAAGVSTAAARPARGARVSAALTPRSTRTAGIPAAFAGTAGIPAAFAGTAGMTAAGVFAHRTGTARARTTGHRTART